MANLVIVAIPREDDYVWKISSEKVPHMTLLFLGDASKVQNFSTIAGFVEHAASTTLNRFGLEVDHRGVLGPDEADVLFFSKTRWSGIKDVFDFRGQLLQEPNIKTAFDSVDQFDEWQPHLTLGYPPTPAKPDNRDYPGIDYVSFDKIGLWFMDFDGLEFPLMTRDWEVNIPMAMSATKTRSQRMVENILEHHGVLGMKWGHRKDGSQGSNRSSKNSSEVKVSVKAHPQIKTILKTKGGQGLPPHKDAVEAKVAIQKLKKSGFHALSNKELQTVATRVNLERQVNSSGVGDSTFKKGQKSVNEILKSPAGKEGLSSAKTLAKSSAGKKLLGKIFKGVLAAA